MSGRAEMSTHLQDQEPGLSSSGGMKVALIGPNEMHRKIVAKALAGSEARAVREFVDYPANLADLPQMLDQQFDVIMIDVDSDEARALKVVEAVASITSAMVMVYSKRNDPDLLMNCMRVGARDFLPLPEAEADPAPAPAAPPAPAPGPHLVSPEPRPIPSGAPRSFEQARPPEPTFYSQPAPPVAPRPIEEQTWPVEQTAFAQPAPTPKKDDFSSLAALAELRNAAPSHSLQQDIDAWDEAHLRAPQPAIAKAPAPAPQSFSAPPAPIVRAPEPTPQSFASTQLPVREVESGPRPLASSEPAKPSFDDWDSAFLRTPSSAPQSNGFTARATIAAVPAPQSPQQASVVAPDPATRPITPADILASVPAEAEASAGPPDTSIFSQTRPKIDLASLPQFHYEVPEEEKLQKGPNPMLWVVIAVAVCVLAGVAAVVFLHPFQHTSPVPQQAQPVVQQQAPPAWQPVTTTDQSSATPAKPSAATPAANVVTANVPTADAPTPAPQATHVSSAAMDAQLAAPSRISKNVAGPAQGEEAPPTGFSPVSIESASGAPGTVFGGQKQVQVVAGVHSISSGVADGMLIRKVAPIYPKFAKDSRIGGTVVLKATITKTGAIDGLQVLSGPKILSESAMNAVRNWRYRPYLLNNQPVDVQTTINVVFNLNSN